VQYTVVHLTIINELNLFTYGYILWEYKKNMLWTTEQTNKKKSRNSNKTFSALIKYKKNNLFVFNANRNILKQSDIYHVFFMVG